MKEFVGVRATRGGILHTEATLCARVKKGEILARTVNIHGEEVEKFGSRVLVIAQGRLSMPGGLLLIHTVAVALVVVLFWSRLSVFGLFRRRLARA